MTYEKLGGGESPFVVTGAGESVLGRGNTAVLVRSASGTMVSPTQRLGLLVSARTGGGRALVLQDTEIAFDAFGKQDPYVRIEGECHHPYVENVSEGKHVLVRVTMIATDELIIDMARKTVKLNGEMVWGYTGRWWEIDSGDVIRAGAEGIGPSFGAFVGVQTVNGLISKPAGGVATLAAAPSGRPEVSVSRFGTATRDGAGTGHRNGRGRAYSERVASGTKVVLH